MIVVKPIVSEKSYALSGDSGVYTFEVPRSANKLDVKSAIEEQFKVKVTKVRTLVQDGKIVSSRRARSRPIDGRRNTMKKAYVTLAKGDSITIFEEVK